VLPFRAGDGALVTELLILFGLVVSAIAIGLAVHVSRLQHRIATLREDERDRVFELSLNMMCVAGFDASVSLVNPQFSAALGWSADELRTNDFLKFVHPDDRESTRAGMGRAMSGEPLLNFRNRVLCKDGTYKVLAWKIMPDLQRKVFYCAARDVTDDDQIVRSFVENIDQVVWVNDLEAGGRVLYVSPAYETIWGRPCSSLYRDPHGWLEAIHPEDRPRVEAAWAMQSATGSFREEYRVVRPDGSVRWIRDRGMAVRNSTGHITRMVGLADDITEYKAATDRLQQTERLASVGTLAAGIAHEINNPIGGIQLAAQAALNAKNRDDAKRALLDVIREASRCARIVDNVLTFARDAGSEKRVADFNEIVRRAAHLAGTGVEQTGITLEVACAPELPPVRVNETELEQAIFNLIQNACEARARSITLRTERHRGGVRLTVEDDGIGMSASQRAHIFEPFFTTRRGRGGTGLGLSITHGIVEDHEGTIEVESIRGLGTKMILNFPMRRAHGYDGGRDGESARR
jgi:PAS domain S-box-containing protein